MAADPRFSTPATRGFRDVGRLPNLGMRGVGPAPTDPIGGLEDLMAGTSAGLGNLLETGDPTGTDDFISFLDELFGEVQAERSADVREQLGGLGFVNSNKDSVIGQQLGEESRRLGTQQSNILAQTLLPLEEARAQRQERAVQTGLQIPGQISALAAQDLQQQLLPLLLALQLTGIQAPVGTSGESQRGLTQGFGDIFKPIKLTG